MSDRELIVDYGSFKITVRFGSDEEVERAKRGLLLLSSKMPLRVMGRRSTWDNMTPKMRAQIERDADWLNDKITAAKLAGNSFAGRALIPRRNPPTRGNVQ